MIRQIGVQSFFSLNA